MTGTQIFNPRRDLKIKRGINAVFTGLPSKVIKFQKPEARGLPFICLFYEEAEYDNLGIIIYNK